jgi:AcrR family transcriptional regulator
MNQVKEIERMRLLRLTAEYLLEHGVLDLRLRSLGDAIGTSHRVLLYYFESKQALITAALDEAARTSSVRDATILGPRGTGPVEAELVRVWTLVSAPSQLPLIRLFLQVVAVAIHDTPRYAGFLERLGSEWALAYREYLVGHGVPPDDAVAIAAEIIGMQRGLQLELAVGGSSQSVDRSFATAARGWAARVEAYAS